MPTRHLVHFALAGLLVLSSAIGAVAQQAAVKISPRDQLTISVWNGGVNEPSYSGKFLVDVDGTFEYPTMGRLKAAGMTNREIEVDLKKRLEASLVSPQVTIEVEQTANKKVVISGEVRSPAPYTFGGEMTIFEALTRAGSLTDEAGDEAVIYRKAPDGRTDNAPIRVDLYELMTNPSMKNNVVLQDGDNIIVPKSDPVYITGFVQTQGPVQVRRDTTVRQAISKAGGVTDRGSWNRVKIQRMVDGKKKDIPVKNVDTDVVKPGDTIVVSARIF